MAVCNTLTLDTLGGSELRERREALRGLGGTLVVGDAVQDGSGLRRVAPLELVPHLEPDRPLPLPRTLCGILLPGPAHRVNAWTRNVKVCLRKGPSGPEEGGTGEERDQHR